MKVIMPAHIHVTYRDHPTELDLPFKIKTTYNALVAKCTVLFAKQIFSSETYDGPADNLHIRMQEVHIDAVSSTEAIRNKIERHPTENFVPKYCESHFEVITNDSSRLAGNNAVNEHRNRLADSLIVALHGSKLAYSYSINNDGTVKHILTVRHYIIYDNLLKFVKERVKYLGLEVTKGYSEKVTLDTNTEYDRGWAPIMGYNQVTDNLYRMR
jgi:hypothetical protein